MSHPNRPTPAELAAQHKANDKAEANAEAKAKRTKAEPSIEDRVARLERSAQEHGWFSSEPPVIPPQPEPPKE